MHRITISFRDNSYTDVNVTLPNTCPHCGSIMTPDIIRDGFSDHNSNRIAIKFGLLVRCTASKCRKYFALEYKRTTGTDIYLLDYSYRPEIDVDLPENIERISSSFVEIYSQATKAESEGLNQISGVGYRKALEFLVKDYAIYLEPDNEDIVKETFLGKVIENHLSNFPKLQNLAKAATWIGNDETHYVRRHDDKDIRDMKQFIKSATHFIVADYDADLAEEFISTDD